MIQEVDILRVLGEPTRFRIMKLLLVSKKEICGCEFVDSLELPQYNLTRHMDALIEAGLVKDRKESRWVYYSACPDQSSFCRELCRSIMKAKSKTFDADFSRFKKRLTIRKNGKCLLGIQNKKFMDPKKACC